MVLSFANFCISLQVIEELVKEYFGQEEATQPSTIKPTTLRSRKPYIRPVEVIDVCPEKYNSQLNCRNGGLPKCKFWNKKLVGIPYCKCSVDFAGQFCDIPTSIAYLKMVNNNDYSSQSSVYDLILPLIIIVATLFLLWYILTSKTARLNRTNATEQSGTLANNNTQHV
uniref:EGF-like domain-containing protein n=1 Tax=Rhabditophanes sp. KR3021 TaxID=114890 RepID=A0AC35U6S2_9BILA